LFLLFFFTAPPPSALYTLSLHDALPISGGPHGFGAGFASSFSDIFEDLFGMAGQRRGGTGRERGADLRYNMEITLEEAFQGKTADRKSTRLNSSHSQISYAVFCLKKKKK